MNELSEVQFDGLVGPTHNYAGLSFGNIASVSNRDAVSNPRAALFQGLEKMRFISGLGVAQAVLPPQPRPHLRSLKRLGFHGSVSEILTQASQVERGFYLRAFSSSSSMWAANAATVVPSTDTKDGRVHFVPANLTANLHRSIEPETTTSILRSIFNDQKRFEVHEPLLSFSAFADEGAANHTRLQTSKGVLHLFAWGRRAFDEQTSTKKFPARQTFEASEALARLHQIAPEALDLPRQAPEGIDGGAFHSDVVMVGNRNVLLLHEFAFADQKAQIEEWKKRLGDELFVFEVSQNDLPLEDAVKAYPFNSQLLSIATGEMVIVAPEDSKENARARDYLESLCKASGPIREVHYLNVRESMRNGGGPACLRLRVPLTKGERTAIKANVFYSHDLHDKLKHWGERYYRDRLQFSDLRDPELQRECYEALDALTQILSLGSVYDFQKS